MNKSYFMAGKLNSFTFISLDGYYKDLSNDISWHRHDAEEAAFSAESQKAGNTLLFGRKTYEMMESFWPSQMAHDMFPEVAKGMNLAQKIVFSKILKSVKWENTKLVSTSMIEEVAKMKQSYGADMTILGSGEVLIQLAGAGLIDEFLVLVDPVILGKGTPIFQGIQNGFRLKLHKTKVFKSGSVLHHYLQDKDQ